MDGFGEVNQTQCFVTVSLVDSRHPRFDSLYSKVCLLSFAIQLIHRHTLYCSNHSSIVAAHSETTVLARYEEQQIQWILRTREKINTAVKFCQIEESGRLATERLRPKELGGV